MGSSRSGGPLLERAEELATIGGALAEASAGRGGVLLIEGTAGIGKTRLLWEPRRLASKQGFDVLGARCDELEESIAFGIAAQLLTAPLQRADRAPAPSSSMEPQRPPRRCCSAAAAATLAGTLRRERI